VLFSPLGPPGNLEIPFDQAYFKDLKLIMSYSCGPDDTAQALRWLRAGTVRPEQVISDFIAIDELPEAYGKMKNGEILKPMVLFPAERTDP
jgi:L-iditol 2-dehydrogenase